MARICTRHLPGNRTCPYPALYTITWVSLRETAPTARDVCVQHLAPSVDDAIEQAGISASARVRLVHE